MNKLLKVQNMLKKSLLVFVHDVIHNNSYRDERRDIFY